MSENGAPKKLPPRLPNGEWASKDDVAKLEKASVMAAALGLEPEDFIRMSTVIGEETGIEAEVVLTPFVHWMAHLAEPKVVDQPKPDWSVHAQAIVDGVAGKTGEDKKRKAGVGLFGGKAAATPPASSGSDDSSTGSMAAKFQAFIAANTPKSKAKKPKRGEKSGEKQTQRFHSGVIARSRKHWPTSWNVTRWAIAAATPAARLAICDWMHRRYVSLRHRPNFFVMSLSQPQILSMTAPPARRLCEPMRAMSCPWAAKLQAVAE